MTRTQTAKPKPEPRPRGLECPSCGCRHFEVLYTRATFMGTIRRRRQCRHCGRRVTTSERMGA
jgi:transcriptional regulator NrdR family protein